LAFINNEAGLIRRLARFFQAPLYLGQPSVFLFFDVFSLAGYISQGFVNILRQILFLYLLF